MTLTRNALGQLVLTTDAGEQHTGVVPVRAYPLSAPLNEHTEHIAIMDADGHERAWIARLSDCPAAEQALIVQTLAEREFMPEIQRLRAVSGFALPSTWQVDTDRGPATLVLKGEEDIRRLGAGMLLITDRHGVNFLIRQLDQLDRQSRRFIDRFL